MATSPFASLTLQENELHKKRGGALKSCAQRHPKKSNRLEKGSEVEDEKRVDSALIWNARGKFGRLKSCQVNPDKDVR
jgi:hypothetical protein